MIESLYDHVGPDRLERSLCPVRALRWYLDLTKSTKSTRLFVPLPRSKKSDISRQTISFWLVSTIRAAYRLSNEDECTLRSVTAHEVRALSASWALFSGIPLPEVMDAAYWRSSDTFVNFYMRDMVAQQECMRSLGPVIAAQRVVPKPPAKH